jgi:hypothetical protein
MIDGGLGLVHPELPPPRDSVFNSKEGKLMNLRARVGVGAVVLLGAVALPLVAAQPAFAATLTVHPGQHIQDAINAAHPGDAIKVEPGTYSENLVIAGKDNLTIEGEDAVLSGPGKPGPCDMGGPTVTGICIVGQLDTSKNPPLVVAPIHNTVIDGLTVKGFSSNGIFGFGTDGLRLADSTLDGNGGYGVFALNSANVTYRDNVSRNNGDAGFYIGESPNANVKVTDNRSYNNRAEGILFRDALGGRIADNTLRGNCVGLLLLKDGLPLAGGNVTVTDNDVRQNNKFCPPTSDAPPLSGTGIAILGDSGVRIDGNTVVRNKPSDPSAFIPGGILVLDSTQLGGAVATNNRIVENVSRGNVPADLINHSTGAGNVFSDNECGTSIPSGLCQSHE